MIERVKELVLEQYISHGSIYAALEERVLSMLRSFRWETAEQLEVKMQEAFPFDVVKATMNEVMVIRPRSGMYRFPV